MARKKDMEFEVGNSKIKLGKSDYVVRGLGYILVTLYAIACVFPFLIIIGTSFTSESYIRNHGVPSESQTYLRSVLFSLHHLTYVVISSQLGTPLASPASLAQSRR